ncbi:MAG: glycogen synthase GlgA [Opitutales bacterium]
MNVLFISPEVGPLVRAGGLGDVVGALPLALRELGIDVRVLCPMHRECKEVNAQILPTQIRLKFGTQSYPSRFQETRLGNSDIPVYLLENEFLFDRPGIYANEHGDYQDNPIRCFALSKAALWIEKVTGWTPDIFHAHDWMAAPLPSYLNAQNSTKRKSRSVLTIHNLEHQGSFPEKTFKLSGLPPAFSGIEGFNHYNSMNLLKGGIQHADKITTVSPTYAEEIRTQHYGQGLEKCLQYRGADLIGILNGIDEDSWNPETDQALTDKIDPSAPEEGKKANKISLLKEMHLPFEEKIPLFGAVSRLYHQKGLDLLADALPDLLSYNSNLQFVLLGSGDKNVESRFQELSKQFPQNISVFIGFDDGLARRIFAGSDFFLMPSRFEPCGLAQQYAMKYGTVPVARKTGGLADTIIDRTGNQDSSNGFLFEEASSQSLIKVIHRALAVYDKPPSFQKIRQNGIESTCSWDLAAKQYTEVYDWALREEVSE